MATPNNIVSLNDGMNTIPQFTFEEKKKEKRRRKKVWKKEKKKTVFTIR